MLLLFVNGDRGLVANKGGMFYFPDRKSNIKEEGLYNCEVSMEKEKYAFVTGNLVKTFMPREYDVQTMLEKTMMDKNSFTKVEEYIVKKVGNSVLCFTRKGSLVEITYTDENGVSNKLLSYMTDYKRDSQIKTLYDKAKFQNAEEYEGLKRKVLSDMMEMLEDEMLKKVSVVAMARHFHGLSEKMVRVQLVNNRFILIETEFHGMLTNTLYAYNKKHGVVKINMTVEEMFGTTCAEATNIDVKQLMNYAIENNIGAEGYEDGATYTKQVAFMGDIVKVECINGKILLDDISDKDKQKVADSMAEYGNYRKKVGRHISKAMIPEMAKLSPVNILGIKNWVQ